MIWKNSRPKCEPPGNPARIASASAWRPAVSRRERGPVLERLNEQLAGREDVQVKSVGCMGLCSGGPLVEVRTRGQAAPVLYQKVARGRRGRGRGEPGRRTGPAAASARRTSRSSRGSRRSSWRIPG